MNDLKDALDALHKLNELRDRAKELRAQGRLALEEQASYPKTRSDEKPISGGQQPHDRWIRSENRVETALLVKVLNHRDMGAEEDGTEGHGAPSSLTNELTQLRLKDLFPTRNNEAKEGNKDKGERTIPVLVAARAMQALLSRSETIFSKATMLCYYRIVRELYVAAPPDWTIGAARAGVGGTTSAFVTGECIRAIFAFEDAIKRTVTFFQQTHRLLGRYELLNDMLTGFGGAPLPEDTPRKVAPAAREDLSACKNEMLPITEWADRAIERMWFDWYISTNPRHGNMALHLGEREQGERRNLLFFHPTQNVDMKAVAEYQSSLKEKLERSVSKARLAITEAMVEIESFRKEERPKRKEGQDYEKKLRRFDRAETAHKFASALVKKAEREANKTARIIDAHSVKDTLSELTHQFAEIAQDIHKVLEPAKRYIRTVLHREVASSALGRFDAGELVFAAASFGAITGWQPSELLTRACTLLLEVLPESGRLPTTRPFHSTLKGDRMLPIGCEMTRSLAQLLQKHNYDVAPSLVRRMLNIFEERPIYLDSSTNDEKKRVAWNFDGSPHPNRPSVWVTAVSVLAIDRVVRMLNDRINSMIFGYFEVIKPEKPHSSLTLNDLVYPDYGFSKYYRSQQSSMAISLEQMRAHVMRVTLPQIYKDEKGRKERVFSAIFYGPPGTGKTTLIEALALSSEFPLVRLSPSDLVVQGPSAIEDRARTVFEALSMLTQVVIILDEFEDVVGQRGQTDRDSKIYEFLRTGMLPKLVKLHDSAREQSFVYCLATNYFAKIDPAAKRRGRFDVHLPVYDPDPLSRAGTLLYRLRRVIQRLTKDGGFSLDQNRMARRFIEMVEVMNNTRASSLAEDYLRLPEWVIDHESQRPANYQKDIPLFWYILSGDDEGYQKKKASLLEEREKTQEEEDQRIAEASEVEIRERNWLKGYELRIKEVLTKGAEVSEQDVWSCLIGPPV